MQEIFPDEILPGFTEASLSCLSNSCVLSLNLVCCYCLLFHSHCYFDLSLCLCYDTPYQSNFPVKEVPVTIPIVVAYSMAKNRNGLGSFEWRSNFSGKISGMPQRQKGAGESGSGVERLDRGWKQIT